jgi:hypothetical protein
LLAGVSDSHLQKHRVYFEVALRHFGEGNVAKAEENFRKTAQYGFPSFSKWFLSTAILERRKLQPDWPKAMMIKK